MSYYIRCYIIKQYNMLCYVLLYSALLYHTIPHYTMLCSAMLCHIQLFLVWGLAPGPRPQSLGPRRELVFNLGAGTWPKASEPQARAGELAPGLPTRPRALRLQARCQTKKTKKQKKQKKTKKTKKKQKKQKKTKSKKKIKYF